MKVNSVSFCGQQANVQSAVPQKGGPAKAVASALIPGLGQFVDGRNKDGAKYLGAYVGLGVATTVFSTTSLLAQSKAGRTIGAVGAVAACAGSLFNYVKNIVDAWRGGEKPNQ